MSITLRIVLIIVACLTFILCIKKLKESKLKIDNSKTWIVGSILLLFMALFPNVISDIANALGFVGTVNFVFCVIIGFLLITVFLQNLEISSLNEKLKNLNHAIALKEYEESKKKELYKIEKNEKNEKKPIFEKTKINNKNKIK